MIVSIFTKLVILLFLLILLFLFHIASGFLSFFLGSFQSLTRCLLIRLSSALESISDNTSMVFFLEALGLGSKEY